MKNRLIILTVIIFFIGIFYIIDIEGLEDFSNSVSIKNVSTIDKKEFQNEKNREESNYDLIELKYKDMNIPYDIKSNRYYFIENKDGNNIEIFYGKKIEIKLIIENNKDLIKIIAYNKTRYKIYNIYISNFPLVNINLSDKTKYEELIKKDYSYGEITIWDNKSNNKKLNIINEYAKFKQRGNSSLTYNKKNYTVMFTNLKSGEKKDMPNLLGLDNNNSFVLNSLYEDNSKIRDKLSLESWNIINGNYKNTSLEYVEVFINNEYYGLYGLSPLINENSIIDKNSIIYKVNSDTNIRDIYMFKEQDLGDFTLQILYPDNIYDGILEPLKKLTKVVYHSDNQEFSNEILKYINLKSCVDYFILLELTHDEDGIGNNSIFLYNKDTKKISRMAWDLDMTWGIYGCNTNKLAADYNINLSNQLIYKNGNRFTKTYLEQRLWQNNVGNFRQKVAKRWKELRSGFLETESFVNYANSLYDEVTESGAREREHERWPDGGYSTDNSFIEKFIRQRLPYLDSQFLQYLDDSGEN